MVCGFKGINFGEDQTDCIIFPKTKSFSKFNISNANNNNDNDNNINSSNNNKNNNNNKSTWT